VGTKIWHRSAALAQVIAGLADVSGRIVVPSGHQRHAECQL